MQTMATVSGGDRPLCITTLVVRRHYIDDVKSVQLIVVCFARERHYGLGYKEACAANKSSARLKHISPGKNR